MQAKCLRFRDTFCFQVRDEGSAVFRLVLKKAPVYHDIVSRWQVDWRMTNSDSQFALSKCVLFIKCGWFVLNCLRIDEIMSSLVIKVVFEKLEEYLTICTDPMSSVGNSGLWFLWCQMIVTRAQSCLSVSFPEETNLHFDSTNRSLGLPDQLPCNSIAFALYPEIAPLATNSTQNVLSNVLVPHTIILTILDPLDPRIFPLRTYRSSVLAISVRLWISKFGSFEKHHTLTQKHTRTHKHTEKSTHWKLAKCTKHNCCLCLDKHPTEKKPAVQNGESKLIFSGCEGTKPRAWPLDLLERPLILVTRQKIVEVFTEGIPLQVEPFSCGFWISCLLWEKDKILFWKMISLPGCFAMCLIVGRGRKTKYYSVQRLTKEHHQQSTTFSLPWTSFRTHRSKRNSANLSVSPRPHAWTVGARRVKKARALSCAFEIWVGDKSTCNQVRINFVLNNMCINHFDSIPIGFDWYMFFGWFEVGCAIWAQMSQIGASQIKAPTGSIFQKYVCSSFMVKMRIDLGSFGLFWFILGWG